MHKEYRAMKLRLINQEGRQGGIKKEGSARDERGTKLRRVNLEKSDGRRGEDPKEKKKGS